MRKQGIQFSSKNNRRKITHDVSLSEQELYPKPLYSKVTQEPGRTSTPSHSRRSYKTRVSRSDSRQKHMSQKCRLSKDRTSYSLDKTSSTFRPAKSVSLSSTHRYTSYKRSGHTKTCRLDNDLSDKEKSDTSLPLFLKRLRKKNNRDHVYSVEGKRFESERSLNRRTYQSSFSLTNLSPKNTSCTEKHSKNISFKTISSRRENSASVLSKKIFIRRRSSSSLSYKANVSKRKYYEKRSLESHSKTQTFKNDFSKSPCIYRVSSRKKRDERISSVRKHSKTIALKSSPIDFIPYKQDTSADKRHIEKNTVEFPVVKSASYMKNVPDKIGQRSRFSISPPKKNASTMYSNHCHNQSYDMTKPTTGFNLNASEGESVMQPTLVYQKNANYQNCNNYQKNSLPFKEPDNTVTQSFQNYREYEKTKRTNTQDSQEHCAKEISSSSFEEKLNTTVMQSVPFQLVRPSFPPYSYCHQLNSCNAYRCEKTLFQRPPVNCSRGPFNFSFHTIEPHNAYSSGNQVLTKPQNNTFQSNFPVSPPYYNSPRPSIYQNFQPLIQNCSPPFCKTVVANSQFCIPPKLSELSKNNVANSFSLEEGEINDTENSVVPLASNNALSPHQCLNSPKPIQSKVLKYSEVINLSSCTNVSKKQKVIKVETKKKDDSYVYNEEAWTIDCVTLVPKVLEQLAPGGLLDDTALEFFFRFLHRFVIKKSEQNLVFFFNSYFYTKLIDGGTTARTRHDAVKRWTNRLLCQTKPLTDESSTEESLEHLLIKDQKDVKFYNKLLAKEKNQNLKLFIWDFDIVGIPLHDSAHHWTLMLVCYPYAALRAPIKSTTALEEDVTSTSKAVVDSIGVNSLEVDTEARDDNSTENTLSCGLQSFDGEKMPNLSFVEVLLKHKIDSGYFLSCPQKAAIFHLDSLEYTFSSPTHIKEIIVEYFQQEFRSRFPSLYEQGYHFADSKEWFFNPHISVPRQKNNYDCGVFLIEYSRYLLTDMQRIQHLLYSSTTSQLSSDSYIKGTSAQSSPSNWFPATQVSYRRHCLRKILLLMQKYPHWKTSKETFEYSGVSQTPLDIMVQLFSSTDPKDLKAFNSWETCEKIKYSPTASVIGR